MFHYSVSGDNRTQVKIQVARQRRQCERHCSTHLRRRGNRLANSHQTGSQRRTSDWKRSSSGMGNQCWALCIHCVLHYLAGGGVVLVLTFSKNNYQNTKRTFNKEGQGLWSGKCQVTVGENRKGKNWHCSFVTNRWNGRLVASRGDVRWHAVTIHCLEEGIQFPFCYMLVHQNWRKESDQWEVTDQQTQRQYACSPFSKFIPTLGKPCHTLPLWLIARFVPRTLLAYLHSY